MFSFRPGRSERRHSHIGLYGTVDSVRAREVLDERTDQQGSTGHNGFIGESKVFPLASMNAYMNCMYNYKEQQLSQCE